MRIKRYDHEMDEVEREREIGDKFTARYEDEDCYYSVWYSVSSVLLYSISLR